MSRCTCGSTLSRQAVHNLRDSAKWNSILNAGHQNLPDLPIVTIESSTHSRNLLENIAHNPALPESPCPMVGQRVSSPIRTRVLDEWGVCPFLPDDARPGGGRLASYGIGHWRTHMHTVPHQDQRKRGAGMARFEGFITAEEPVCAPRRLHTRYPPSPFRSLSLKASVFILC